MKTKNRRTTIRILYKNSAQQRY